MKQSAKTLGVTVLGAAFAAAGASTASAAPVPDPTQAVGGLTQGLPVAQVAQNVPGATEAVGAGQNALSTGLNAAQPAIGHAAPAAGLLGGLPVG
ncbi:ATP-binding protein [Streptomyces sp. KLOTTS4A1]|uniref:ATP-binding protein n=1 Tax=Streptomyces sp. KLOTTS4A1 TaxID=3390996 RepID=UPI0039F60C36